MEDYARFGLNDGALAKELKGMRHGLGEVLSTPPMGEAIAWRDTEEDVGTGIKMPTELRRDSMGAVVVAAGKRLSESLRVLEECGKTIDPRLGQAVEKLRYRGYVIEQTLARTVRGNLGRERFSRVRLYVLLTESLCHPAVVGGGGGRGCWMRFWWGRVQRMVRCAFSCGKNR